MLAYPIHVYGSESLNERYLPGLISLERVGGMAFTEADTGSDPTQLKTRAEKVDGEWRINGAKRFITHSAFCHEVMVFAKTGNEVTAFLVESNKAGYRAGKREVFLHVPGLDNGDLYLEDYAAPDDRVIGDVGQGFEILLQTEAIGKVAFMSLFVGLAERAFDLALQYANTRTHRGKAIGRKFQMTQWKIARMMTRLEAMNAYLYQVCAKVDAGKDIFSDAAVLKLMVAEDVKAIMGDAMEIHGAYGLSEEYDVAHLYRMAVGAPVVMGSLDIQRVIVSRGLLWKGAYG
jgi:alkylation response protein AidB-like acyl-CoA dehydrogenase